MKSFPEKINAAAFATSWDGRLTTEAQLLCQRAQMLLQNGRNHDDNDDLRKAIAYVLLLARSRGFPAPMLLELAGIIAGAVDRSLYGWFGRAFMRVGGWWLEGMARARGIGENAPGWNDYLLAYWMMTGHPDAVEELFFRATEPVEDPELLPMKESAAWMVGNIRIELAEFDRAYREVEAREGQAAAVETSLASNIPAGGRLA